MNYSTNIKSLRDSFKKPILIFSFSCLLIWLGYFTPRQSFGQLISLYSALYVVYFFLVKIYKNARDVIFLGVFFRLLLLFAVPALSDDFYRFVWDGRLLANGINPYTILPADFIKTVDFQNTVENNLIFGRLNSPNYYTVYPPLNQLIFAASATLSKGSLFGNVFALRIFILLAEISLLFILMKNKYSDKFNFYSFNPLIIIELTGNLHFEGIVMCFLVLAFYVGVKNCKSLVFSSFLFACAICVKLLPLILIPLIIKQLGWKKGIFYASMVGVFTALFFLPFLDRMLIQKLFSSVNLYFQKFEFNASIYYLVRAVGFKIFGYNIIGTAGKIMAFLTFSGVLFISWKSKSLFVGALAILTLYFAMATTVHPWYVTNLLVIAILTRFRYPIVWSYTIFLSYAIYQTNLYQENLWLVALEYLLVFGMMIYEFMQWRNLFYDKSSQ
jgi:alpha-1,6-mannosyltransferase